MKKKDRQRMLEKYMKCAAWGSAGILLTCFIRGHVIKENGTVRELKISFLEKEKEVIADCAVGNIMTTLTYTSEKDHVGGPAEDVTQTVMKLFPIGTYLSAEKEDTIAEDSQTYAMILEKQANDENAVDENGKLITQGQSVTQQEMVKIPEAKVDISMDKLRDYEYLMSHFYTVDSSTMADANLINADRLLGKNMKLKIIKKDQNNLLATLPGAVFKMVPCTVVDGQIKDDNTKMWTGTTDQNGEILFGEGSGSNHAMDYNTIYKVTEETAPTGYVADSKPIYIMVPRKVDGVSDYSNDVKQWMQMKDPETQKELIHVQYQSTYELTVLNHKGEITVEKKFKDPGGHDANPVSGTYKFGLYENADGTNTTNSTNPAGTTSITAPLQTITITYNAAEKDSKTAKFTNLDLKKTYYVFELDDNGNPIKDSTTVATVNKMEYFTSYEKPQTGGTATGGNSAVSGDTVTVTNQIRVKELPSTGSYGPLIFRLAGAVLIFFAGLQMLINIKRRACNNR